MTEADARRRAEAKYAFLMHAIVFAAVMLLLILINLFTSPGNLWFIWPLIGWGLAVAMHAARVFILPDKSEAIDALTARELNAEGQAQRDTNA